jgi:hypothetical protein
MRIQGRTLRPSNLAERRLLLSSLGTQTLRVPRKANPYLIARRLERAAKGHHPDVLFVCDILAGTHRQSLAPKGAPSTSDSDAPASD